MEIWRPRKKPTQLDRTRWKGKNHHFIRVGSAVFKVTSISGDVELTDKELMSAFCIVACIKDNKPSEKIKNTLKRIHENGKIIYGIVHKDVDMNNYPPIRWKKIINFEHDYEIPNLMKKIHDEIRRDNKF